jgi:hypothetical protein
VLFMMIAKIMSMMKGRRRTKASRALLLWVNWKKIRIMYIGMKITVLPAAVIAKRMSIVLDLKNSTGKIYQLVVVNIV